MEPSEKVKAKNLAKKRPNFSKSKNLKILSENKKNYCKKNHLLLKQTKNYFACLFFGFWGSSKPKKQQTNKWSNFLFVLAKSGYFLKGGYPIIFASNVFHSCCWFCIHFWIKWELWKTFDAKIIGWTHFRYEKPSETS